MTAKRFKIVGIEEELYPMQIYYDGDKELSYDEVCNLLNELHEENVRLREEIQGFIKGIQKSSRMSAEAIMKGRDPYEM